MFSAMSGIERLRLISFPVLFTELKKATYELLQAASCLRLQQRGSVERLSRAFSSFARPESFKALR